MSSKQSTLSLFKKIKEFHDKFGLGYEDGPRDLDKAEMDFRLICHQEEINEFSTALEFLQGAETPQETIAARADMLDALVDAVYFLMGTAHRMGLDFDAAFDLVHEANMTKEVFKDPKRSKRGFMLEVSKPVGWKAPDLTALATPKENWPTQQVKQVRGLIALDGPDCTGKTTLAKHFCDMYEGEYIHLTWSPKLEEVMDEYRLSAIRYAIALSKTKLVIIDRPWISQVVYSEVHRGGTHWPELAKQCDDLLIEANALQILCLSDTIENNVTRFSASEKGEPEMYKSVREVAKMFNCIWLGELDGRLPVSSDYLCDIMSEGGLCIKSDFYYYSIETYGANLDQYCSDIINAFKGEK